MKTRAVIAGVVLSIFGVGLTLSSGNLGIRRMARLCAELEVRLHGGALDGIEVVMAGRGAKFKRVMEALAGARQMVSQW